MTDDERFMKEALALARIALEEGEFPVGCVLIHHGKVVATGARTGTAGRTANETDHAEMMALRQLNTTGFEATDPGELSLYCTMEPCLMCFGAILLSGIGKLVYAYEDVMGGVTGYDLSALPPLYTRRRPTITPKVLRKESLALFKAFFENPENQYWRDSRLSEYTLGQMP